MSKSNANVINSKALFSFNSVDMYDIKIFDKCLNLLFIEVQTILVTGSWKLYPVFYILLV